MKRNAIVGTLCAAGIAGSILFATNAAAVQPAPITAECQAAIDLVLAKQTAFDAAVAADKAAKDAQNDADLLEQAADTALGGDIDSTPTSAEVKALLAAAVGLDPDEIAAVEAFIDALVKLEGAKDVADNEDANQLKKDLAALTAKALTVCNDEPEAVKIIEKVKVVVKNVPQVVVVPEGSVDTGDGSTL